MNLLFVCSKNRLRSPTAEAVFSEYDGVSAIGAGINPDSEIPLSGDLIEWADIIFVMEDVHRKRIKNKFNSILGNRKLVVLGIPDHFDFMDPKLILLLKQKVEQHLK